MHTPGPPVAKRSIDSRSRCLSTTKSRSSVTRQLFSVIELRRIGVPFTINDFFANRPSSRPIKIRGGHIFPIAISIAAEQCASACAAFILPHSRSLSGLNCAIRSFTSSTAAASKRVFTEDDETAVSLGHHRLLELVFPPTALSSTAIISRTRGSVIDTFSIFSPQY